jgi:hypothetical protein
MCAARRQEVGTVRHGFSVWVDVILLPLRAFSSVVKEAETFRTNINRGVCPSQSQMVKGDGNYKSLVLQRFNCYFFIVTL